MNKWLRRKLDLEIFLRRLLFSNDKTWLEKLWFKFLILFTISGFVAIIVVVLVTAPR